MDGKADGYLADINDSIRNISSREYRASIAISLGLVPFIKCSPRQKKGPSKGTLSSTISALVYATWSDSGGDWSKIVEVMRFMRIYPTNSTNPEIRPDSEENLTSSSNMDNGEAAFATSEQEHTSPSMTTVLTEYIEPSAVDLTSAGSVVNACDTEVPDQYRLSAFGSPMGLQDWSDIPMGTPHLGSSPSPSSYMWISPANSDTDDQEDLVQASDGLPNFDTSHTDGISTFQDFNERERTVGTSTSSTMPTGHQGALTRGEACSNRTSSADQTATANDEEKSASYHTPNQDNDILPQEYYNTVTKAKFRAAANRGQSKRQRKTPSQRRATGSTSSLFIAHERGKVLDRNLRCPEDFFTTKTGRTRMVELDLENHADDLEVMNYTLGGCETFAVLGEVLRAYRQDPYTQLADIVQDCSLTKRLQLIHNSNGKVAYHVLLKNVHILYFTREAESKFPNSSTGFIQVSQDSQEPQSKRQRGNPLYLAEAAITKNILKDVYPDVDEGSAAYSRLYSEVKVLRKYGQRLDKLVEVFGFGILGLIPLVPSISTADQAFEITHKALFTTTNKVFKNLIVLTNECQGEVLRTLARAAQPLIEGILHQETGALTQVGIGNAPREHIMQYPKGAPELVRLLSHPAELRPENAGVQHQCSGSE